MGGFSIASVVLSYFLTAGGLLLGSLLQVKLKTTSEPVALLMMAAGAFVGGFLAARASRGSTIIEPAIGAVLVVVTLVVTIMGGETGKAMWHAGGSSAGKYIAEVAAALMVGAAAGAFLSEKMFGEATTSGAPWIIYSGFTAFGATFMIATLVAIIMVKSDTRSADSLVTAVTIGGLGGILLAGIAAGASARMRILGPAFLGGALGMVGLVLFTLAAGGSEQKDIAAVTAVLAVIGGVINLTGAAIGWAVFGKRNA